MFDYMNQTKKLPKPTWSICVWKIEEYPVAVFQIDMINEDGTNDGSTNPDRLRSQGYEIPDLTKLEHGRHFMRDVLK